MIVAGNVNVAATADDVYNASVVIGLRNDGTIVVVKDRSNVLEGQAVLVTTVIDPPPMRRAWTGRL